LFDAGEKENERFRPRLEQHVVERKAGRVLGAGHASDCAFSMWGTVALENATMPGPHVTHRPVADGPIEKCWEFWHLTADRDDHFV
jgi:hypothetical protein